MSDGNSQEPGSGEQEAEILGQDLAHEDVFEAALDLHRARTAGRLGRLEAERFLLALGDDIRALSPLLALRGGDPRAVTMTLHLATQVVREMPQLEKEVM